MHQTDPVVYTARKAHRCDWCWQHIVPGEVYSRYRIFDSGEATTMKLHAECYSVMMDEARQEGGFIEWTPGQERPRAALEGK
jgi:hypothetical protein